jgi:hypothetical protein
MINNTDGANQVGFSSGNILEYVFDMYLAWILVRLMTDMAWRSSLWISWLLFKFQEYVLNTSF